MRESFEALVSKFTFEQCLEQLLGSTIPNDCQQLTGPQGPAVFNIVRMLTDRRALLPDCCLVRVPSVDVVQKYGKVPEDPDKDCPCTPLSGQAIELTPYCKDYCCCSEAISLISPERPYAEREQERLQALQQFLALQQVVHFCYSHDCSVFESSTRKTYASLFFHVHTPKHHNARPRAPLVTDAHARERAHTCNNQELRLVVQDECCDSILFNQCNSISDCTDKSTESGFVDNVAAFPMCCEYCYDRYDKRCSFKVPGLEIEGGDPIPETTISMRSKTYFPRLQDLCRNKMLCRDHYPCSFSGVKALAVPEMTQVITMSLLGQTLLFAMLR